MNIIAFSLIIEIGLFLKSQKVIYLIGTSATIITYLLIGSLIYSINALLTRISVVFLVKDPIINIPSYFINKGIGFTISIIA